MKRTLFCVLGMAVGCLFHQSAHAEMIDFDFDASGNPIVSGTQLSNEYASIGVTFEAYEDGFLVGNAFASDAFGGTGTSTGNAFWNIYDAAGTFDNGRQDLQRINFASAVTGVSFVHNGYGDQTTLQAYDGGGNLLETIVASGSLETISFSSTGIRRLDMAQQFDDFAYAIDDLSFSAVPEPSGLAAIFGTAALMLRRRIRS